MPTPTRGPTDDAAQRRTFDVEAGPAPSATVVSALAALDGRHPTDLTPLARAVDPDALDRLFAPSFGATTGVGGEVSFTHEGYRVTVRARDDATSGEVLVRER
ncbi:MAG: HalOD1 output domain-containing protein [Halobacteriaceae archaeon]